MKKTSLRLNTGLFIILLMITSCNMTGEFALNKRLYTKGYQLKTPVLTDNNTRQKDRNRNSSSETKESTSNNENNDLIVSSESYSISEFVSQDKSIAATNINFVNEVEIQTQEYNTEKTIKYTTTTSCKNDSIPLKTNNINSMIGFISCCFSYVTIPIQFIGIPGLSIPGLNLFLNLIMFLAPICAIVFGLIGLRKIKKDTEKYKGKAFAKIAFWGGIGYYIILIIVALVLVSFVW